jgi:lactose/L-arabinose transport system permease protein
MFIGATNSSNGVASGKLLPGTYLIKNLTNLFTKYPIHYALINSVKIAGITVVASLLVTSLAAYGFEKFATKASNKAYTIFLLGMMIPSAALMIPLFKIMAVAHLVNNAFAVILPGITSIFLIFFFRQSFKSLPDEILESARIDGANEYRIFFRIVIPSMKTTYAAATIYSFMTSWNSYMWPLIALQSENKKTLTLVVSSINKSTYVADYGVQMAGLAIATLPMLVVFLIMQRSFVEGLTGSIKG